MKIVKYEEALQRFKDEVVRDRMQKEVAEQFGVSRAFICNVVTRRTATMTEPMLEAIGVKRTVVLYEEEKTSEG